VPRQRPGKRLKKLSHERKLAEQTDNMTERFRKRGGGRLREGAEKGQGTKKEKSEKNRVKELFTTWSQLRGSGGGKTKEVPRKGSKEKEQRLQKKTMQGGKSGRGNMGEPFLTAGKRRRGIARLG